MAVSGLTTKNRIDEGGFLALSTRQPSPRSFALAIRLRFDFSATLLDAAGGGAFRNFAVRC
jgi:hypothetical protein